MLVLLDEADQAYKQANYDATKVPWRLRVPLLVNILEFELTLGGPFAWLTNSFGRYAAETVEALDVIGARTCAALVPRMIEPFPNGAPSKDDSLRFDQATALEPSMGVVWDDCCHAILGWPDDIIGLLLAFVRRSSQ
jgi:hypothetical protein